MLFWVVVFDDKLCARLSRSSNAPPPAVAAAAHGAAKTRRLLSKTARNDRLRSSNTFLIRQHSFITQISHLCRRRRHDFSPYQPTII
jgi:hypothetical protein